MIAYLEGSLVRQDKESCVVLTPGGVGYQLFPTLSCLAALPDVGERVVFFVYTVVREDAFLLFAFASWEERQTFAALLAVPKLGPKTALSMLGCFSPSELAACIAREDAASLAKVPGIGLKTAKRLLLDLKDKISAQPSPALTVRPPVSAAGDCAAALLSLGYGRAEVDDVTRRVFEAEPDLDAGGAVRQALKLLATHS